MERVFRATYQSEVRLFSTGEEHTGEEHNRSNTSYRSRTERSFLDQPLRQALFDDEGFGFGPRR